jgi:methylmalonyl-CoA mutase N-terminal domain/subunit
MSTIKRAESGFEVKAEYRPGGDDADYAAKLGAPGEYPFTRHIYPTGYRERPWAPSLYSGFGQPAEANIRYRYLLEQGNGRANVAFDLPTQIGLDSDDPSARGEVGRVGVAVDSLRDFEILLDQIPLDRFPVSLNINSMAPVILAMLVAVARKQGTPLSKLSGTIANDILHEFVARGTWRYEVEPSMRLATDVAEFVTREMPSFYPFNLRTLLLHESGASPPQEIGFGFAIARANIESLLARGLTIDEFAPKISFFFGTGLHLFEEAAKFRAARRLWATMMRDDYGSHSDRTQKMRFTCVAACGSHFTKQLPELNLVRGTLGCLASALGGAQAMLGTTLDEAYDIPTQHAQLLALRTQQIVALESDVTSTVDPLGGSYFVEALTDEIERLAVETIHRVEDSYGGVARAIETAAMKTELEERAYELEREVNSGERPWVGVNIYRPEEEQDLQLFEPDEELADKRAADLAVLRDERSSAAVARSLVELARAAESTENIMPAVLDAVESYATLSEIAQALEGVFGRFRQPATV